MATPPPPFYKRFRPATKLDPAQFAGTNINLKAVSAATSVEDANSKFSARAAAAIYFGANATLASLIGEDYGYAILAKMAYADYFSGPVHSDEVSVSVAAQQPGTVGSANDKIWAPKHPGDYDMLLTAYVKLYYAYYFELSPAALNNLFNNLLSVRGQYDDSEQFALTVDATVYGLLAGIPLFGTVKIPETENHRLMIQSAKYLTNQLYFEQSVLAGSPDRRFDNNRNGNGGSNPSMVDVILTMLTSFLTNDFREYNARPYQDFTMTALLNLHSFAYDDRVRLAARMVLDYISAKVAVSSQNLRRATPFRRRNEDQHFGPTMNGFLTSPLVANDGVVPGSSPPEPYEPDPRGRFTRN